jgi:DNA-binding MarR family transcriptional regulator
VPQREAPHNEAPQHRKGVSRAVLSDIYIASHHRMKRAVDEGMQAAGLSLARAKVLKQLRDFGPMRQQALADCFGFAPRSITDMVNGLERDGLAERLDDPDDRRANLVRITDAGRKAVDVALTVRDELVERIFAALSAAERAEFARLIGLLNTRIATLPPALAPADLAFSRRRPS